MGYYDTAQICLKGHVVTDSYNTFPAGRQAFCQECGSKTITACPTCNADIRGNYHVDGVVGVGGVNEAPAFCHSCGKSYPWSSRRRRKPAKAASVSSQDTLKPDDTRLDRLVRSFKNHPLGIIGIGLLLILGWIGSDNVLGWLGLANKQTETTVVMPVSGDGSPTTQPPAGITQPEAKPEDSTRVEEPVAKPIPNVTPQTSPGTLITEAGKKLKESLGTRTLTEPEVPTIEIIRGDKAAQEVVR